MCFYVTCVAYLLLNCLLMPPLPPHPPFMHHVELSRAQMPTHSEISPSPSRQERKFTRAYTSQVQERPLQPAPQHPFQQTKPHGAYRWPSTHTPHVPPPPLQSSYSTRFLAGYGACLTPCQYKPRPPSLPSVLHEPPPSSDQMAGGKRRGSGLVGGRGAANTGREPNEKHISSTLYRRYPVFQEHTRMHQGCVQTYCIQMHEHTWPLTYGVVTLLVFEP